MIALKGMNAQQKARFEQQAVIGLAGVFVLVFLMGPVRMLLGGGKPRPAQAAATPSLANGTLPQLMQHRNQQLENPFSTPVAVPAKKPTPLAAAYTAGELRDPMKSLLPVVVPAASSAAQKTSQAVKKPKAPPKAPPKLDIQGLLWGGDAPKAIISGQLYGVGDMVQGVQILGIDRTGVTVEHESGTLSYEVSNFPSPQQRRYTGR